MSAPREYGASLEGDSLRILQQAVAAAEQAVTGTERITARASQLEGALGAFAKTHQALIETRERAVAEAQERAFRAIAAAESALSVAGKPSSPTPAPPGLDSPAAAQEPADEHGAAFAQAQAMQAIDAAEQAMQQAAAAQAQAIDVTNQQAGQAVAAAVAGTTPELAQAKTGSHV